MKLGLSLDLSPKLKLVQVRRVQLDNESHFVEKYAGRPPAKPDIVALIAPHTCAERVISPKIRGFSNRLLLKEGVTAETFERFNSWKKGWALRQHVGACGADQNELISNILALEDNLARTSLLRNFFAIYPDKSIALEMHAINFSIWASKSHVYLDNASDYRRIGNTQILAKVDPLNDFVQFFHEARQYFESIPESLTPKINELAKIIGLDVQMAMENLAANLILLIPRSEDIKAAHFPAAEYQLQPSHSMFSYYYDGDLVADETTYRYLRRDRSVTLYTSKDASRFEADYCALYYNYIGFQYYDFHNLYHYYVKI